MPKAVFPGSIVSRLFNSTISIAAMHGLVSHTNLSSNLLIKTVEQLSYCLCDKVIVVSPSLSEFALREKYVRDGQLINHKYTAICGVSEEFFRLTIRRIEGEILLGYFGRFSKSKGLIDLFMIGRLLKEANVNYRFYLCGPDVSDGLLDKLLSKTLTQSNIFVCPHWSNLTVFLNI